MNHDAPTVVNVTASAPALLIVEWSTGETLRTDISEQIERFEWLRPLRDTERFAQAEPGLCGHGVAWSDEINMGADLLYWLGLQQAAGAFNDPQHATLLTIATEYRRSGLMQDNAGRWVPCVLKPLQEYVLSLQQSNGKPMHKDVAKLLFHLLHGAVRPRRQKPVSETSIREAAEQLYINHEALDAFREAFEGVNKTTQKKVIGLKLAEAYGLSTSRIGDILASRKPRKTQTK